jgi:hypothetical protein
MSREGKWLKFQNLDRFIPFGETIRVFEIEPTKKTNRVIEGE